MIRKLLRLPGLLLRLFAEDLACQLTLQQPEDGVLVVKLDAIGDFIVWLGFAPQLRRHYQPLNFILVCNQAVADLARTSKCFDTVVPIDLQRFRSHWPYRLHTLRSIRKLGCSIAIQPTHSRRFLLGESMIRCSGSISRIGSVGDTSNSSPLEKWLSDRWYTQLLPAACGQLTEQERHQHFLRGLGIPEPSIELARLHYAPWPRGLVQPNGAYVVLFPGAGSPLRRWPVAKFSALAKKLHQRHQLHPVICGSSVDIEQAAAIVADLDHLNIINLCGATTLPELFGVIANSSLLVANETSAIHISAATATPAVCLLGGGHYGRFIPYPVAAPAPRPIPVYNAMPCFHCNWQCIHPLAPDQPAPCLDDISVDAALKAAEQALSWVHSPEIPR